MVAAGAEEGPSGVLFASSYSQNIKAIVTGSEGPTALSVRSPMTVRTLFARLVVGNRGQDLIEYGLLAAIIGVIGILIMPTIEAKMDAAFALWNAGAYADWCPDDPGGGATCSVEP
jgi:Flp pilus assembly pilin Flp